MEVTKRCPYCGEEILAVAIKCKHCSSFLSADTALPAEPPSSAVTSLPPAGADYGWILLAIPLAGALLIWMRAASMGLIIALVLISTAALAAFERSKAEKGTLGAGSASQWGAFVLVVWIVGYPAYLFDRRRHGLPNRLSAAVIATVLFVGSIGTAMDGTRSRTTQTTLAAQPTYTIPLTPEPTATPPPPSPDSKPPANASTATAPSSGADAATPARQPSPPSRVLKVSVRDLILMYDANEVAANQKIGGAALEITGLINSIDEDVLHNVVIQLASLDLPSTVGATLSRPDLKRVARMQVGQELVVRCMSVERILGSPQASDCQVISVRDTDINKAGADPPELDHSPATSEPVTPGH